MGEVESRENEFENIRMLLFQKEIYAGIGNSEGQIQSLKVIVANIASVLENLFSNLFLTLPLLCPAL